MKKVKVIIREWECKEVEYICEVDDADLEDGSKWNHYGIGYLNGVQVNTGSVGTGTGTNGRFNLASYNGTGAEVLDGNIGAVRAYTKILGPDDILQNFNAQRSMYGK